MTKEDIIAMAQEARDQVSKELPPNMFDLDLFYERFVALVRADEREACAKVCDDALTKIWEYHPAEVKHAAGNVCTNLAAAIRARGNT